MHKRSLPVVLLLGALAGACSVPDVSAPEASTLFPWRPLGTGIPPGCGETMISPAEPSASANVATQAALDECDEWESRQAGSRTFNGWAPPLIFGDYVWLDDHIGKVSYTVTASPVASGAAITGEVKYANGTSWTNTPFSSSVYFTTGNAVAAVEARFKNNNPTGTAVTGSIYW